MINNFIIFLGILNTHGVKGGGSFKTTPKLRIPKKIMKLFIIHHLIFKDI